MPINRQSGSQTKTRSHDFSRIPGQSLPRSTFNRSSGLKTTFDSGFLVPIYNDEIIPGDTVSLSLSTFARMATPLHAVMDNLHLDLFFFFVPHRLVWDNWQKFMGEQDNPGDSIDFQIPQAFSPSTTGILNGSLQDYYGLPTQIAETFSYSNLPFRGYNLIFNDWFRDENLTDSLVVDTDDGPDNESDYTIQRRLKRHDYFSSCLPFRQKGPDSVFNLGESAPLLGGASMVGGSQPPTWFNDEGVGGASSQQPISQSNISDPDVEFDGWVNGQTEGPLKWGSPQAYADLTQEFVGTGLGLPRADLTAIQGVTVNDLRDSITIQQFHERDARGGSRYTESTKSHFGISSSDARLNRPEYLGGGHSVIMVNPIANTTADSQGPEDFFLGDIGSYVTDAYHGRGFVKTFSEHGTIIGLACIRADLNYQQGLHKKWTRSSRFDFYFPTFANLGEQPVKNSEIFMDEDPATRELTFGFQERFAEYRYGVSTITGQMRSNFAQSLDTWHLAQEFDEQPLLNDSFIREDPPIDRIIAVPSEPDWLFDAWFQVKHTRVMPTFSVPGLNRL